MMLSWYEESIEEEEEDDDAIIAEKSMNGLILLLLALLPLLLLTDDNDEVVDLEVNSFPGCNGKATAELPPLIAQSQPNLNNRLDPCTVRLINPITWKKVDRRL